MQNATLESRPLYSIGTVSRLTGIKADTLRVWERRYGLGASQKSPGGRREYTQYDMEHLQIIATLVDRGMRIGEIANRDRRTLEVMFESVNAEGEGGLPEVKPRVLFIGEGLANWLDDHQGCIGSVAASICRRAPQEFLNSGYLPEEPFDAVIVEFSSINAAALKALATLRELSRNGNITASHPPGSGPWLDELKREGYESLETPLTPGTMAFALSRVSIDCDRTKGDFDLGQLINTKTRKFSDAELQQSAELATISPCGCPAHLGDIITALNTFEQYSADCSVKDWQEAAVHSCVYAYTNQARWLMEKALTAVLDYNAMVEEKQLTD